MPENIQNTDPAAEEKKLSDSPEADAGERKETSGKDKKNGKPKSKFRKILTGIIGGIIGFFWFTLTIFLPILLALILIFIDPILVFTVRKGGTYITGTEVKVENINLSLKNGTLLVDKFSLDNPEGFSEKKAVEVKRLFVSLDIGSLFTNKIIIRDIDINGLNVSIESSGKNFTAIQKNIEKKFGSKKKKKPAEKKPSKTKVVIKHLKLSDSTIYWDIIPIPINLEMSNIGGDDGYSWEELKTDCSNTWSSTTNSVKDIGNRTVDGIKNLFK